MKDHELSFSVSNISKQDHDALDTISQELSDLSIEQKALWAVSSGVTAKIVNLLIMTINFFIKSQDSDLIDVKIFAWDELLSIAQNGFETAQEARQVIIWQLKDVEGFFNAPIVHDPDFF